MDMVDQPVVVSDRRSHSRRRVLKNALIVFNSGYCTMKCQILEMSGSGAKLLPSDPLLCPNEFVLKPQVGEMRQCEVRWRKGTKIGVSYIQSASEGDRSEAPKYLNRTATSSSEADQDLSTFDPGQDLTVLYEAIENSIVGGTKSSAFLVISITNMGSIVEVSWDAIESVLIDLAWRTRDCLRSGDVLGRLSKNRLGVVLPSFRNNGAAVVTNKILALGSIPAKTSRGPIEVRLSVNSILFPAEHLTAAEILRRGVEGTERGPWRAAVS